MNGTENVIITVDELKSLVREAVRSGIQEAIPTKDKLNTPAEAAKLLRVSLVTLARYRANGLIKESRIGKRKVYYKDSDINAAINALDKSKNVAI